MSFFALILVFSSACLHAGWNLLAHRERTSSNLFLRISLVIALFGLAPAIAAEFRSHPFPPQIWLFLLLTGVFQTFYYLGLTMGYRSGDFSVVYPLARSLPILLLAFFDIARGYFPSSLGCLGILLVIAGCVLLPLKSFQEVTKLDYWNNATIWILVTVFATLGYTTVDKLAAEILPEGADMAARYGVWQAIFTIPFLWLILKLMGEPTEFGRGITSWILPTLSALFVFSSYWLMLWAYQISVYTSYLFGLRQLSIVIGVVLAALIFREPVSRLRIVAATIMTLGIICISLVQ